MRWIRIRKPFHRHQPQFLRNSILKKMQIFNFEHFFSSNSNSYSIGCSAKLFYEPSRIQRYKLLWHYEHLNMFKQRWKGKGHPKCTNFSDIFSIYLKNLGSGRKSEGSTRLQQTFFLQKTSTAIVSHVLFSIQKRNRQWYSAAAGVSIAAQRKSRHRTFRQTISFLYWKENVFYNCCWCIPEEKCLLYRDK